MTIIERGDFSRHLQDILGNINAKTISAGLLSGIFGISVALVIIGVGTRAQIGQAEIISWVFATYFFGALTGLILAIVYGQPISGAWSIPGAAMVAVGLKTFTFNEMIGAYLIANLIVTVIGVSGLMGRVIKLVPMPIVLAMIVGVLMSFATGMFTAFSASPLIAGAAILVFALATPIKEKVPPILLALVVAALIAVLTGQCHMPSAGSEFILPQLAAPVFNISAIISVSVPLALLVICGEMPKAAGVLMAQGYQPPINSMTALSGVGGMIVSFFGGPNVNIAGPMTAICGAPDAGPLEGRYASVLVNAILFGVFGAFASVAVPFVSALPSALIVTVAGLAMVGVLLGSLQNTFAAGRFQIGAFFALAIAMSNITFLSIAAPVWSLVGGVLISLLMERQDFCR